MLKNSKIIKWYRCPVDKKVLKELSSPNDVKGFIYALGHLVLWFGAGALSYYNFIYGNWLGFIAFIFIQGTIACFFNAAHHELHHDTVFNIF